MKTMTIQSLTLHNWRGEKERVTTFNGGRTSIYGANGLGKSRLFDAFCWLLFGKDSQNRTDYELRTYDAQHQPLHKCECSVEALLSIDGEPLTLKREWCENWVKPQGQPDEVFKNNETRCTWNGVPVSKGEYNKRLKGIIDESLFKMITNPRYFPATMTWQQQREVLKEMAGEKSDYEIAADNKDFKLLLDELNGKSLSDFRKEIAATKKKLKESLAQIPARMDEVQRSLPDAEDWKEISDHIDEIQHDINSIDKQLQDSDARSEAERKERDNINKEITICKAEQSSIVRHATAQAQEMCDKQNEYRRGIENSLKHAHEQLAEANIDLKRNAARIAELESDIRQADKQLEDLRKEWHDTNAAAYDESGDICPCCGQRMPEEMIASARAKFAAQKKERLAANNEKGKSIAGRKKSLVEELERKKDDERHLKNKVEGAENGISTFSKSLAETPRASVAPFDPAKNPAWAEQQKKIEELERKLAAPVSVADTKELNERKAELQAEADALKLRLAKREQIEQGEARMKELEREGKQLALKIAELEGREFIAEKFSKRKIEDCEGRINGIFKSVRFKLFGHTLDGNEYECCVPLVNGVPYPVANTASQINAGLDIINALCKFYGVTAPIFIDNAESVNEYEDTPSQVIYLRVSEDPILIIK